MKRNVIRNQCINIFCFLTYDFIHNLVSLLVRSNFSQIYKSGSIFKEWQDFPALPSTQWQREVERLPALFSFQLCWKGKNQATLVCLQAHSWKVTNQISSFPVDLAKLGTWDCLFPFQSPVRWRQPRNPTDRPFCLWEFPLMAFSMVKVCF